MKADCHIHMVLDGVWYKDAIAAHKDHPRDDLIHAALRQYQALGYTYLRDGGDRWGVGVRARELAGDYGITYRSPIFPICKLGHYGGFIGKSYESIRQYPALLQEVRRQGGNFVKIMISGLMDFDRYGVLKYDPLDPAEIRELIHIAHEEGFTVMAHANGAQTVIAASQAGVESIEHGAYLNQEALCAMAENQVIWVPTLSTIGNLRGEGRFRDDAVMAIFDSATGNVAAFAAMGGLLAPGSDAGAYAVPHGAGSETEYAHFRSCLGEDSDSVLARGTAAVVARF